MPPAKFVFARGEARKAGLLALAMCALAHANRDRMRSRWLKTQQERDLCLGGLLDHPAFGYLYENALCFGTGLLLEKYFPVIDHERPMYSLLLVLARGLLMVDPFLLSEKFMAAFVYQHVPYFAKTRPPQDFATLARDYMRTNFPVMIVNSLMQVGVLIHGMSAFQRQELVYSPPPQKLSSLFAKFVWCRIVVDVVFGVAHRFMHENKWVYSRVHQQHHEHTAPRTQTNFHFTALDQFVEAVFPLYVAFGSLSALGVPPTRVEQTMIGLHLLYYESASHTGKEIPIVTWLPFISPLWDYLTNGSDDRLIEYHTRHHQLYRCNYSISPWFDKLCGTYRIDLPKEYDDETSLE